MATRLNNSCPKSVGRFHTATLQFGHSVGAAQCINGFRAGYPWFPIDLMHQKCLMEVWETAGKLHKNSGYTVLHPHCSQKAAQQCKRALRIELIASQL